MTAIRGILAFSMVGWLVTAHAELVPGLPVYSMDGSVDTSRTLPGFQAEVLQISTPLPANLTGMTVDDEGRVWIAWQSDVLEQDGEYSKLVRTDVFLGKLEDGGVEIVVPVASQAAQPWWTYAITAGPGGALVCDQHGSSTSALKGCAPSPCPPGSSQVLWDGTDDSGRPVASGVYLYRLQEGDHTWAFRRMALIR